MLDALRKYVDALAGISELSRDRAEQIIKDLQQRGEVRARDVSKAAQELVTRSVNNRRELIKLVRKEIDQQLKAIGVTATTRKTSGSKPAGKPKSTASKTKTAARKTTAKAKSTAKTAKAKAKSKTPAKAKSTAKKAASGAKKTAAKAKTGARKATSTKGSNS